MESAPRDGTVILGLGYSESSWEDLHDGEEADGPYPYPICKSLQPGIWWMAGDLRQIKGVTKWMPLPSQGDHQ